MKTKISVCSFLVALLAIPAFAGWEYNGYYVDDGVYRDDGSRFTVGIHGGLAMSHAKLKNEMGSLYADYYIDDNTGVIVSSLSFLTSFGTDSSQWPTNYSYAGYGDLATVPIKEDFKKNSFTAGVSAGFTLPEHTQWRIEAGYDYIAETNYNQTPLLEGNMNVSGGDDGDMVVHVYSTGVKSSISTDIISANVYYDFFDGKDKKLHEFIPYVGFGLGYAISKTTLQITDIYGDLSLDEDLQNYGTATSSGVPGVPGVLKFDNPTDKEKYPASTNIALLGALGFSYGIAESTFLDASFRLMYIPKITWNIANSAGTQSREWFSAENMIYTNFMVGLRFEF